MPAGPFSIAISGFVVSGSSSSGTSPAKSANRPPASRWASSASSVTASARSFASPDFACVRTRSSRPSTWSRSATSSSSSSCSRSPAGIGAWLKGGRHGEQSASTRRRLPSRAAPVPGTSCTRIAAGVSFAEPSTRCHRLEPRIGDRRHADVRLRVVDRSAGVGERVEKRRLARLRQPDDAGLEAQLVKPTRPSRA